MEELKEKIGMWFGLLTWPFMAYLHVGHFLVLKDTFVIYPSELGIIGNLIFWVFGLCYAGFWTFGLYVFFAWGLYGYISFLDGLKMILTLNFPRRWSYFDRKAVFAVFAVLFELVVFFYANDIAGLF